MKLVPEVYKKKISEAVTHYWRTLSSPAEKQKSGEPDQERRAAVTGGKQMEGFCELIQWIRQKNGLRDAWVLCGDFLLQNEKRSFDFIIGNPPYIRIEQLSATLQAEYRSRYASLFDRADIYVAFIEHGLDLLSQDGKLSFPHFDFVDTRK